MAFFNTQIFSINLRNLYLTKRIFEDDKGVIFRWFMSHIKEE